MGSTVSVLHLAWCVCLCSTWLCVQVCICCACVYLNVHFNTCIYACALCVCVEQDVGVPVHWWAGGERRETFPDPPGRSASTACLLLHSLHERRHTHTHSHVHVRNWCHLIKVNLDLLTRMRAARKENTRARLLPLPLHLSVFIPPSFFTSPLSFFLSLPPRSLSFIRYSW